MTPIQMADAYLARRRRSDAVFAAMCLRNPEILQRDPDQWTKRVGPWLLQIGSGTLREATVDMWLTDAKVDWGKRLCDLKWFKRDALAVELEKWVRAQQAEAPTPRKARKTMAPALVAA